MRFFLSLALACGVLSAGLGGAQAADPSPASRCGAQAGLPGWTKPGVYQGRLGGQSVTLQLFGSPIGDEVGAYFYQSRQIDLSLSGGHQGQALVLAEEVWGGPEAGLQTTGCLRLNPAGSGLQGEWKSLQGRRLPLILSPLNLGRVPLRLLSTPGVAALRRDEPLAFLKLNTRWQPVAGGVREPLSGVVYPRIAGASAGLAGALQDRQLIAADAWLQCRAQIGNAPLDGAGYQLSAQVTHLGDRLVSLREHSDYYCAGAHPDSFTVGVILDRQSGAAVNVAALWPTLKAARLYQLYLAHYPADNPDCSGAVKSSPEEAQSAGAFSAWLSAKGLTLVPTYLPHVAQNCAEEVVLPYAELRALADSSSSYFADVSR